jgi:hypothetical protein
MPFLLFPGMDPFLEDPAGWPDVHHSLLSTIREHLAEAVSPHFYVRVEERVYLSEPPTDTFTEDGPFAPDIILTTGRRSWPTQQLTLTAAAPVTAPVLVEELFAPETHDYYLEVRDARAHKVITAIELLSPANKVKKSRGRKTMLEKHKLLRQAGAHWLEIDLLRAGVRDKELAGRSDYCVTLFRRGQRGMHVWFIDLRDPLPTVAVPLRSPFGDVPLNLQQVFSETYRRAHYADSLDYTRSLPSPRLKPADAAWVKHLVTAWHNRQ